MRFLALDSWRGIAAMFITLYHLPVMFHFAQSSFMHGTFLAVDFFFVLSGFVITYSYFDKMHEAKDFMPFVIKRFARLWPLHVFMLILLIGYEFMILGVSKVGIDVPREIFEHRTSIGAIFTSLTFLHSMGFHDTNVWNLPSWSISVEFFTYITFAILALFARKFWISACVVMVGASAAILIYISRDTGYYIDWAYDYGIIRCFYSFFAGSLVYKFFTWYRDNQCKTLHFGAIFEILAVLMIIYLVGYESKTYLNMLSPLIFGFAIFVFAFEAGPISRLFKLKPFLKMGDWSYSIYLTHYLLMQIIMSVIVVLEKILGKSLKVEIDYFGDSKFMIDLGNVWANDLLAIAYLAITLLMSAFTYKYVELWGQKYFKEKLLSKKS